MNAKTKWIVIAVVATIIVASAVAVIHVRHENECNKDDLVYTVVNEYIVDSVDFSICDEEFGSEMLGTLFLYDVEGSIEVILSADFCISSTDVYGIAITSSEGFYVTSVDTNYREDYSSGSVDYTVLRNEEGGMQIRIGDVTGEGPDVDIGGDGTVLIKMTYSNRTSDSEKLFMEFGVGKQHTVLSVDLPGIT